MSQEEVMQEEIDELQNSLEHCQDEWAEETQRREALADALAEALTKLEEIETLAENRDLRAVFNKNA